MKKYRIVVILSFIILLLLFYIIYNGNSIKIKIDNPIILSHNSISLSDGKTVYVNLEMKSGKYFYGCSGGETYETNWKGKYQIRIYSDELNLDNYISINPIYIENNEMNFSEKFKLEFDDYNNDLNPDFTLGQYASGNYNIYRIYTILTNGELKELSCDDGNSLMISKHDFSIKLEKVNSNSFKTELYNSGTADIIEQIYEWKDSRFVSK